MDTKRKQLKILECQMDEMVSSAHEDPPCGVDIKIFKEKHSKILAEIRKIKNAILLADK